MSVPQIPPELLGPPAPQAPPTGTPPLGPGGTASGAVPNVPDYVGMGQQQPMDPAAMQQQPMMMQPPAPLGQVPTITPMDPGAPPPPQSGVDTTLLDMLNQVLGTPFVDPKPKKKKFAGQVKPDEGMALALCKKDEDRYSQLRERMSRDIQLYRQAIKFTPPGFDPLLDVAFQTPELSTIVNKLTNMCSGLDMRVESPDRDEQSYQAAQAIEDFCYYTREQEVDTYALSGSGNLQWDEFLYLYLMGRYVKRILPDESDERFPFNITVLDPSTVYPTWGGGKDGLVRVTQSYHSTAAEIIGTWGLQDERVQIKIRDKLGYDAESVAEYFNHAMRVNEYWDKYYHAVFADGEVIVEPTEHDLPDLPFVYQMGKGEPGSLNTPGSTYAGMFNDYESTWQIGEEYDLAEKGVSIFHHLVNTHKSREILNTLLMMETIKAQNPATITYTASSLMGKMPPPIVNKPGAGNIRIMNQHKVEPIPTSPRPSDIAPIMNQVQQDMTQATLPPHVFGMEQGSNVSGFAVESLISAAKDTILPYVNAWQTGMNQQFGIMLRQYLHNIAPVMVLNVPGNVGGSHMNYVTALTAEMVELVGSRVKVTLFGIAQQNMGGQVQTAMQAVGAGFWSLRSAREYIGVKNPDKEEHDITSEKAMQHPALMEMFIIPQGFIDRGDEQLAQLWLQLVVAPKMGGQLGPGGAPTGQPGAAPPGPNGQSAPMLGAGANAPPPPGGPAPGQGRGPSG